MAKETRDQARDALKSYPIEEEVVAQWEEPIAMAAAKQAEEAALKQAAAAAPKQGPTTAQPQASGTVCTPPWMLRVYA